MIKILILEIMSKASDKNKNDKYIFLFIKILFSIPVLALILICLYNYILEIRKPPDDWWTESQKLVPDEILLPPIIFGAFLLIALWRKNLISLWKSNLIGLWRRKLISFLNVKFLAKVLFILFMLMVGFISFYQLKEYTTKKEDTVKSDVIATKKRQCWQDICTGMKIMEVKDRLESLGFVINNNLFSRWLQRWMPHIGGVFEYERYVEYISAKRLGPKQSYTSLNLGFVRFPSGNLRLYSLESNESIPVETLASKIIANFQEKLGPPDGKQWAILPNTIPPSEYQFTVWEGNWRGEDMGDWVRVEIRLVETVNVEEGDLLPKKLEESVHAHSINFVMHAMSVGRAVESALRGEKAGWIEDSNKGCRIWNNFPRRTDEVSWDGPCKNGYADGYGIARWSEHGIEYETDEGEFRKGKLNGHAVITAGPMRRFEGEFHNNFPEGQGTLEYHGEIYSGAWSKGCFNQDGRRMAFFTDRDQCDSF